MNKSKNKFNNRIRSEEEKFYFNSYQKYNLSMAFPITPHVNSTHTHATHQHGIASDNSKVVTIDYP